MLLIRTTQIRLVHLMQHLANHSTYHRGQVALMMRQLHAEPLATDFHVFLVEGRREPASAYYNNLGKKRFDRAGIARDGRIRPPTSYDVVRCD
jgi:DinB family